MIADGLQVQVPTQFLKRLAWLPKGGMQAEGKLWSVLSDDLEVKLAVPSLFSMVSAFVPAEAC